MDKSPYFPKISHIMRWISIVFSALGVLFTISIIGIILIPTSSDAPLILSNEPSPSAGSPEFLETLSHLTNTPIGKGSSVTMIPDTIFLPTLLLSIKNASSSIDFTDYPWSGGSFSDQIFSALSTAAQRGVAVRVLLDSWGSQSEPEKDIDALKKAGVKVAEYHQFSILDPIQYDERDHMRAFIIDGNTAFIGSVGVADYWIGNAQGFEQWNDFMFEMHDTMAQAIQSNFAQLWRQATSEILSGPEFYPAMPLAPVSHEWQNTTNSFISISSLPSNGDESIRDTFVLTALSAKKKLYIISPYIIPDQGFLTVLENRARAGVDVRILSPGPATVAPILRSIWHSDYEQLLEAGVRLYEYQPSMIHAKMMLADDQWTVVGSANLDNRSNTINAEDIMGISDPIFARQLDTTFINDLKQSEEITLANWQKQYGLFSKLYSKILLILYKQY